MTDDDSDTRPEKMEKKSKKNKNRTNDMLNVGDLPKKKVHKNKDKKRKSRSNDDVDEGQHDKGNLVNNSDLQKKDKKKKRKRDSSENAQLKENEPNTGKKKTDGQDSDTETNTRKKKTKSVENNSKNHRVKVKDSKVKRKTKSTENNSKNQKVKVKDNKIKKKVSFSGHVEVFPSSSDNEPETQTPKTDGLIRGKRFTPEEDAIVKEAVFNYITAHGLGDEGLKMVLNCKSIPGMKKCWQEIGTCIPYRPSSAVYYRAHILFERGENRSWTPEEIEFLKQFHEKHGNDWKTVAEELGKHRFHVKDTWRRIKFANLKLGKWSQEEYQNLYDLVNLDLQMKVNGQKKSKHGMLRDNIPWTAISEKLTSRSDATCCMKWYNQLTSSLVVEKKWCDADDYRLIGALYELDATCVEDVDWDGVLEHRPGEICLKRWNQMVKHIGYQGSKPFSEQVDILAKRYCPDLAEVREEWDNKPVVP